MILCHLHTLYILSLVGEGHLVGLLGDCTHKPQQGHYKGHRNYHKGQGTEKWLQCDTNTIAFKTHNIIIYCTLEYSATYTEWVSTTPCHKEGIQPLNRQIIQLEFSPTCSCVSLTRSTTSSEWKLFRFDKMEVNCFKILLIAVTFYL